MCSIPLFIATASFAPQPWGEQKPALFVSRQQEPGLALLFLSRWEAVSFDVLVIVLKVLREKVG